MNERAAPSTRELRLFALTSAAGFATMFGLVVPLLRRAPLPLLPWGFAAAFLVVGMTMPATLRRFHSEWFRLIHGIGAIQSRIVLTFVFIFVITPLGIALRVVRRKRNSHRDATTCRVPSVARDKSSFEKPY